MRAPIFQNCAMKILNLIETSLNEIRHDHPGFRMHIRHIVQVWCPFIFKRGSQLAHKIPIEYIFDIP